MSVPEYHAIARMAGAAFLIMIARVRGSMGKNIFWDWIPRWGTTERGNLVCLRKDRREEGMEDADGMLDRIRYRWTWIHE